MASDYILLFPSAWRTSLSIQSLTITERGVLIELICYIHDRGRKGKCEETGFLSGFTYTLYPTAKYALDKMVEYGVATREANGIIAVGVLTNPPLRPSIPPSIRKRILSIGYCAHCGSTERLTLDHIVPYSRGGAHEESNFQALCWTCNRAKSNKMEDEL